MTEKNRAIAYIRVSTHMQERDGVSIDQQLEMARRFCHLRGLELVDTYTDIMSGSSDKRPGLVKLEADLEADVFDHVLVYKLDRLSRDPAHYHGLLQRFQMKGVGLASLTQDIDATTPMGKFILNIMIATAELEVNQTADRVRDSIHYRARQGRILMGKDVPLGYIYHKAHTTDGGDRVLGRLEVEPNEAASVAWMFERFRECQSLYQVVSEAPGHGYTMRDGKPINRQGLTRILRSPLYKGYHASLKTKTIRSGAVKKVVKLPRDQWHYGEQTHPAIVSEDLWEAVQVILDENGKMAPRLTDAHARRPWSGLLRCEGCGSALIRKTVPGGRNRTHKLYRYVCDSASTYGKGHCPEPARVSEAFLDQFIIQAIIEAVQEAVSDKRAGHRPTAGKRPPARGDTAKELAALEARRQRVKRMYERGDMSDAEYDSAMDAIKGEMQQAQESQVQAIDAPPAPRFAADLLELWARLEAVPGGRNQMLRQLIQCIYADQTQLRIVFVKTNHPDWPQADLVHEIIDLRTNRARK